MLPLFVLPWLAFATPTTALPAVEPCVDTARAEVEVVGGYDGVRVVTADGDPGAAIVVSVLGDAGWASLTAPAGGASTLTLTDQTSRHVILAVEPALDAPVSACARRIELVRRGEVVAAVDLAGRPAPTR
ncbi:MAG: hypothetical protein R3B06_09905 [Kofleriaceae bacterium]